MNPMITKFLGCSLAFYFQMNFRMIWSTWKKNSSVILIEIALHFWMNVEGIRVFRILDLLMCNLSVSIRWCFTWFSHVGFLSLYLGSLRCLQQR